MMHNKKLFEDMFDTKINQDKIKKQVLNKAKSKNQHNVAYVFKLVSLSLCIVMILFGLGILSQTKTKIDKILNQNNESNYNNGSSNQLIEMLIGSSQYVFIGTVKDVVDKESNIYNVEVISNIKGELGTKKPVQVVVTDNALENNLFYVLMPSVIDGELKIYDSNKIIALNDLDLSDSSASSFGYTAEDNYSFESNLNRKMSLSKVISEYETYYRNEIVPGNFEFNNEISRYDVNYKE